MTIFKTTGRLKTRLSNITIQIRNFFLGDLTRDSYEKEDVKTHEIVTV